MNAFELLRHPDVALPAQACTGDFVAALEGKFATYNNLVSQLSSIDFVSQQIRQASSATIGLSDALINALRESLKGRASQSMKMLNDGLNQVKDQLEVLRSVPLSDEKTFPLYRIRKTNVPPLRSGLFHIPFEAVCRVEPRRYSVLGVPMLYLGSTVYVCWEECDRPSPDDIYVSAFRLRKHAEEIRILNLAYRPGYVATMVEPYQNIPTQPGVGNIVASYATVWPLIAACSFRRQYPGAPFTVEYVIPQLLLSWLMETDEYHGIRYFSTRVDTKPVGLANVNFVFAPRAFSASGYCTFLKEHFELTLPHSAKYLLTAA